MPTAPIDTPGKESEMHLEPQFDQVPDEKGGSKPYVGSGKLKGKRAIITGGDSGIGRAAAILFAIEGANSLIAYLPEEEADAQETKKRVEARGGRCHLVATDLTHRDNCRKVVDKAVEVFGGIDIVFNNAAYQRIVKDIKDLPE